MNNVPLSGNVVKNIQHLLTTEVKNRVDNPGRQLRYVLTACLAIVGLLIIGRHNYLLFHALVELGAVAVAWSVFFLVWSARRLKTPPAFVTLGIGCMIVGALDLLHTLAYEGMGVFPGAGADLATQLWIAARFIETATLLLFLLCFNGGGLCRWGGHALTVAAVIMLGGLFVWDYFPECFNAETGLTPFKIASEYIVMGVLAGLVFLTVRKRKLMGRPLALFLSGAMLMTIVSEFCFTLYASPFGTANMIGHLFKVVSFMLIYRALIVESLERPMETLAHGLRKETERYARIIETAVDGFWMVDMRGRIRDVNAAAERMTGLPRDTLLSMGVNDIEVNESPEETARHMKMVVEKGHDLFETRHRQKDGSVLNVEVSCSFLPYDNGRFIVFSRDITDRKNATRMVLESEARYRSIVSALPDLLFCIDDELRFKDVQTSVPEMLLAPPDEIVGKTVWEILPPTVAGLTETKIRATLKAKEIQVYHYTMDVCGETKKWESRMVPYGKGEVLAIVRDITEQRRMALDLAAEHAKLEAIFNASPDILVLKDNDSVYRRVNPTFCSFIGKDDRDIIGRTDHDLFPEKEARQYTAGDAAVVQTGVWEDKEWQVAGRMGRRWLQVIKTPVCTADGRSLGVLCTGRDISEHHRLKKLLLNSARKEQEKLALELHDGLCQDLKGLEIQAALLEDGIVDNDNDLEALAADLSKGMNLAVRKAYGITQGMLPINLGARGFSEALRDLAEKTADHTETRLLISARDDLSPQNQSQAHQLYRIAQEAVNNALQHSNATEIELIWRAEKGRKRLSVRDNGIGIGNKNHKAPGGFGLRVMSSRAQSINAVLTVRNRGKCGTEVLVEVEE